MVQGAAPPRQSPLGRGFLICVRAGAHPAICYLSWDDRLRYGLVVPKGSLRELASGDWVAEAVRPLPRSSCSGADRQR